MKKNILLIVAALMVLASCGRKVEFEHNTFATFDGTSYSIEEDSQMELKIPVTVMNPTGAEVSVSVKTVDGKAQEGVDYEIISPVSGILTFSADETQKDVIVAVNYDSELTGTKDFTLTLSSATEGFMVGQCNSVKVRIKDADHPLKAFIGEWTASAAGLSGLSYSWSMIIEGDESDPTYSNLLVYDLDPFTAYFGYTSENGYNRVDAKANAAKDQITIAMDSYLATDEDGLIDTAGIVYSITGLDSQYFETARSYDDVNLLLSEDGSTLTIVNAFGVLANGASFYEVIEGPTVFTKK